MLFKSLEIQGFKSFADPVTISVGKGVTCIVGPNGSGKSNVTDAVRWVLGEQNAKLLRGSRMEDLIFSGTKERRALGFAEVSIELDNESGELPIEYATVKVSRRIYRSGESRYLINNTNVRLKDVESLFYDTGLGKDGYSIIGQGKIEEILSGKAEDRRKIFEEAAGIQKYKISREESKRKLLKSRDNLLRINDIIGEIESRLGPLQKEAEAAGGYLKLYEEMKGLDILLSVRRVRRNESELETLAEKLKINEADVEDSIRLGISLEEKLKNIKDRLMKNEELRSVSGESRENLSEKYREFSERISAEKNNILIASEKERQNKELLVSLQKEKNLLEAEKAEKKSEENKIALKIEELKPEFEKKREAYNAALKETEDRILEEEKIRKNMSELRRRVLDEKSRLHLMKLSRENFSLREKEVLERIKSSKDKIEEKNKALNEYSEKIEKLKSEEKKYSEKLYSFKGKREELESRLISEKEAYNRAAQELDKLGYRLDALRQMSVNLEGYSEAVKFILNENRKLSESGDICGTAAELIDVPKEYALAVETALGFSMQNIIVKDDRLAAELIEQLKKARRGRQTFLPLNMVKPAYLRQEERNKIRNAEKNGEVIGIASELVSCPENVRTAVDFLLCRTVICESLEYARQFAKKAGMRCKIVSLDGSVISAGGAMTGGQGKAKSGFLSRKRELSEGVLLFKKLEAELPKYEHAVSEKESELLKLSEKISEISAAAGGLEKNILAADMNAKAVHEAIDSEKKRLSEAEEAKNALTSELRQNNCGEDELIKRIAGLESELSEGEKLLSAADDVSAEAARKRESLRLLSEEAAKQISELQGKKDLAGGMCERIAADILRLDEKKESCEQKISAVAAEKSEREADIRSLESKRDEISAKLSEADENFMKGEKERQDLERLKEEAFEAKTSQQKTLVELQSEFNRLNLASERKKDSIDGDRRSLWENYSLTAEIAEEGEYLNINSNDKDEKEAGERLRKLKNRIREFGNINVNAPEEYKNLKERCDFLRDQAKDIEEASEKLERLIKKTKKEMQRQFSENLEKINKNFKTVFQQLFQGGNAEIKIQKDVDVLESEIEIKASPPGKKLQNMMLLSGGERSLTAIALLFAILKLRPAPFCILDEIEAALDEANVQRFTNFIKNYSGNTQFLIVTHRKRTMEAADSIYGITMPEPGVSKLLSVRLE